MAQLPFHSQPNLIWEADKRAINYPNNNPPANAANLKTQLPPRKEVRYIRRIQKPTHSFYHVYQVIAVWYSIYVCFAGSVYR